MPHAYGYRSGTRNKFSKPFRTNGAIHISKTLQAYRKGDLVDIIVDGAIHKGMPHHFYHGRTGRVFNVNPRSIGVIVTKQVRNRIIEKRIHVRVEHLRVSTTREDFLRRIKENDVKKCAANKAGKRISTKRIPALPRDAHIVTPAKPADVLFQNALRFTEIF